MTMVEALAAAAARAGYEIFWLGAASPGEIDRLETLVGITLPESFRDFLARHGGGGIVDAEISGIENDDAARATGGTVWGDTQACRTRFGLPDGLAVVYFHDDETCWAIDGRGETRPVVSYNLPLRRIDREIAPDFEAFLRLHLGLYAEAAAD